MRIVVTVPGNGDVTKVQIVLSADDLVKINNGVKVSEEQELETATEAGYYEISVIDEAHVQTEVQPTQG